MTTLIWAQSTNPNRNIAGRKTLKSLPVAFFFQERNIDFTVSAHEMARFQNCVMLFKMAAGFQNYLGPRGHFPYQYHGKQNPKRPRFWLALSLSPTAYIIHLSR